ncbi:phosphoribosylaminoimidazole carboxylase, chloroplastic-like isoform X1 [Rhododendron vialii]|uniref:phosphoribosylaminoimidazole carboxylase, chloroplastic-like isoform X1 n=3 Tax=Rhododendron vialii TaxID=182163 RepID=UPI0026600832|nr:phosphoribosylaminoimidazole carboxylase, chloroplastic-like isoform X1 [Rhododendron vialii]
MLHLSHPPPTTATLSGHHIDCGALGSALSTHRSFALGFSMANNFPTASSSSSTALKQHTTCGCGASPDSCNASSHRKNDLPIHGVSETIVGVLGGGQLGRMLCQAASQMAIKVIVLDPEENCPAGALSHCHVVGSYDDSVTVKEFAKRCSVLTFEIEHVNVETLEKLEQRGLNVQPKASTIRIIQDKYLQKVHFSRHGIPLPKFMKIDDPESAKKAGDLFGYPFMIKSKRLAYDGRGNAVAKREEEISSAVQVPLIIWATLFAALGGYDHGLYVEQWAPFVKELAVIVARGRDKSILCYPVVETIHRENICHIVKAPANVPLKIRKLATDVAYKAVCSLEGAGVFAVELFLTEDGQILLNEVAPRPHNSGHHTIESCFTSQYEQHLRAILGLQLGDPSMKTQAAIMYNILGEDKGEPGFLLAYQLIGRALGISGATVHWYDKPEMRKQRKMGHITIVGPSMAIVETRLKLMLNPKLLDGHTAVTPRVGIIMGSDSDLPVMKDAARILNMFDIPNEVRIVSAHRTPDIMFSYASSAGERGIQVIIAGAGGAAHLPGMVAALTPLPVIGVPVRASSLDGLDSLLSIVQMPRGVPVATVAINNATNAGLLAVRMLGVGDADLQARMSQYLEDTKNDVLVKAEKLEEDGWEAYLNS